MRREEQDSQEGCLLRGTSAASRMSGDENEWRKEVCAKIWEAVEKIETAESWNFGLRATRSREPRQARKGATVPGKPSVPRRPRSSSIWRKLFLVNPRAPFALRRCLHC